MARTSRASHGPRRTAAKRTAHRPSSKRYATDHDALVKLVFGPTEYARRRRRICEEIGPGAWALVQGAGPVRGFEIFRQTNQMAYCCGIDVPQAYLLISGGTGHASLFLPHRVAGHSPEGDSPAAEDAAAICRQTDLDAVYPLEELGPQLRDARVIYMPHAPAEGAKGSRDELMRADRLVAADPWDGLPSREARLIDLLRERLAGPDIRDLSPILDTLRAVKSPLEVNVMRAAGRLTAQAILHAMRATRPGMFEYQLGAVAQYVYLANGARGEGYRAIIASGANTWFGHYFRNDAVMQAGDWVLMDVAPDYHGYTSDIGRMWPIDGRYRPWQRELYGFIVEYHKAVLSHIRPGVTADVILDEAAADMAPVVDRTRFSKAIYREAAKRALTFRGHMSHPVGMAVHDNGTYRKGPLTEGHVIAVDPQMWIPEEKLYVRVEDTIVVTADGMENLTAAAPLELDDVEAEMKKDCGE